MMDVYFNGYGRWANQIDDNDFEPIGDDYEVGGVFKLRDIDEKTYIHTGNFDHIRRLQPSIDHTDCEFNKIKEIYQCANPENNPKFIFMDVQNRNPAFYCMDSYERINSVAINNADNPTFLININRNYKLTAINSTVIDSNEERESVTAQGENKTTTVHLYNDVDSQSYLNAPLRTNDWFIVIDEMTKVFFSKHQKLPNPAQAWVQLTTVKLDGYEIKTGEDTGEPCLIMPGVKNLSRSAFNKRWGNYTANKIQ